MLGLSVVFATGLLAEVVLYSRLLTGRPRQVVGAFGLVLTTFASGALVAWRPTVWSGLFAVVSLYRAFNIVRVVEARMHEQYLRWATRRTAGLLLASQGVIVLLWAAWAQWHATGHLTWALVAGGQLAVAIMLLASTMRSLRRTQWPALSPSVADRDLPTISVAIPARNETEDLQACLASVIASDYPKLEILVLDDCSQNRRTPEIIRSFAHDGVRFIQGEEPRDTWLPKNQAYRRLAAEASGDYIVFCGVDVRFAPDSLRQMILMMLSSKKQMLSILPQRDAAASAHLSVIQAMRYWWELVPPRRIFNRPPVLSSCWAIKTAALKKAGGFAAVSRSIVPEAYFAKRLLAEDGYSFRRAGTQLGLASVKSAAEQRDTAIRTRYPQVHRRPEQALSISLAELMLLELPFVLAVAGYWLPIGRLAWLLAVAAAVLLTLAYGLMAQVTRSTPRWFAPIALPIMVLVDVALLHYSMWQYEFSTVSWKGRNVCVPVMHVVPHLPEL